MKTTKAKESFVFRISWQEVLMDYPPEVRLEVYDAIIAYAASGTLTELKPLAKMAFSFIKRDLDIASEKYQDVVAKKAEAGRKGMKSRWKRNNTDNKSNKDNKCYSDITDVTPITNITDKCKVISDIENSLSKEKEKKISQNPEPCSFEEISLEECYKELLSEEIWAQDVILAKYRQGNLLTEVQLKDYIGEFFDELRCRGETSRSLRGVKEHFSNWLNVKLEKKKQNERNTSGRSAYTSKQEANDYALQLLVSDSQSLNAGLPSKVAKPF